MAANNRSRGAAALAREIAAMVILNDELARYPDNRAGRRAAAKARQKARQKARARGAGG